MLRQLALWALLASLFPVTSGCVQGDDPEVVALLKKHEPAVSTKTFTDEKGAVWVVNVSLGNKSALDVLPNLATLSHMRELVVEYENLSDDDLGVLPALPQVQRLRMSHTRISDAGLKHLAGMTDLRLLDLRDTLVEGDGIKYLGGLTKLETLYLTGSPLNDSAMPHIVKNFKRLKRFDFVDTKVSPTGLMQLAELHWLTIVGPPNDIAGLKDDPKKQREARRELIRKYVDVYNESKRKARAAGEDVPPDTTGPFGLAK